MGSLGLRICSWNLITKKCRSIWLSRMKTRRLRLTLWSPLNTSLSGHLTSPRWLPSNRHFPSQLPSSSLSFKLREAIHNIEITTICASIPKRIWVVCSCGPHNRTIALRRKRLRSCWIRSETRPLSLLMNQVIITTMRGSLISRPPLDLSIENAV